MNKVYLTANEVKNDISQLSKNIKKRINDINTWTIVSILRGGLIPAGFLSYFLDNRDVEFIDITLYGNDESPRDIIFNDIKNIKNQLQPIISKNKKKLLIIDDLIDTGKTVKAIYKTIDNFDLDVQIKTAVIYQNKNADIKADFYTKEKPEGWIVFPWDEEE